MESYFLDELFQSPTTEDKFAKNPGLEMFVFTQMKSLQDTFHWKFIERIVDFDHGQHVKEGLKHQYFSWQTTNSGSPFAETPVDICFSPSSSKEQFSIFTHSNSVETNKVEQDLITEFSPNSADLPNYCRKEAQLPKITFKKIERIQVFKEMLKHINSYKSATKEKVFTAQDLQTAKISAKQRHLKGRRGNNTKYTKHLLLTAIVSLQEFYNHDAENSSLCRQFSLAKNIRQITQLLRKPEISWYRDRLQEVLKYEGLPHFLSLMYENNAQRVSMIMESVPVLMKVIDTAEQTNVDTWSNEKLEKMGNFSNSNQMIENGTATFDWVYKDICQQYRRLKDNFKQRQCSEFNNKYHFWCQTMRRVLDDMAHKLTEATSYLKEPLSRATSILHSGRSRKQLMRAISDPALRKAIRTNYIDNLRIFQHLFGLNTNIMVIKMLMEDFETYKSLFDAN